MFFPCVFEHTYTYICINTSERLSSVGLSYILLSFPSFSLLKTNRSYHFSLSLPLSLPPRPSSHCSLSLSLPLYSSLRIPFFIFSKLKITKIAVVLRGMMGLAGGAPLRLLLLVCCCREFAEQIFDSSILRQKTHFSFFRNIVLQFFSRKIFQLIVMKRFFASLLLYVQKNFYVKIKTKNIFVKQLLGKQKKLNNQL